jgi:polygalacturonase
MLKHQLTTVVIIGCAIIAASAMAQDTRHVTEPVIPHACITLHANRTGAAEKLDAKYENNTDTLLIQTALDYCRPGKTVELATGSNGANAFLTGSLELAEGAVLVIDKGVTLYGSRNPSDYDPNPTDKTSKLLCGTMSDFSAAYTTSKDGATSTATPPTPPQGRPCKPLISVTGQNAAIMGDGIIDGRGGAVILGHDYTWWQMARRAEPRQLRYFSGRLIVANHADGLILYRINLHNAPNYHVSVANTDGFTAWGVHLLTPTVRGTDTRNTDGIDPGNSTNITIAHSWIDNGDDNIAIKANVQDMSVLDNHFYDGHGMSIGSDVANVNHILVDGLTEDHTSSGVRIKSNAARGGPVHDVIFRNICMRGVAVPIAISPFYNNGTIEGFTDPGVVGNRIPDYKAIRLEKITSLSPGDVLIAGKDADHITDMALSSVQIMGITPAQVHGQFAHLKIGPGSVNFTLSGEGVSIDKVVDRQHLVPIHNCPVASFLPMK